MGFSKIHSAQITNLEAKQVDIEVDIAKGLYSFSIIGLGDKAVEEAKDRVCSAIKNTGYKAPKQKSEKVTVSLAPAYSRKHGSLFDVAIALGYLEATEEIQIDNKDKRVFLGELALDGSLRHIHGTLPLVRFAKQHGFTEIFLPNMNAKEAALVDGINIYGAKSLWEIIEHIRPNSKKNISKQPKTIITKRNSPKNPFKDIKGQEVAKRALTIAAAGSHNIALYGPPGTGKTLLAKAFNELLPQLSTEDIFDITSIYSAAGLLKTAVKQSRPFRSPHHSASYAAMCGGGVHITPGEITLAHKGVLFMDEFPEFERKVIDSLRQPLEEGVICISRASGSVTYPANFILVATLNPCPCGYKDTGVRPCTCSPNHIKRYQQKISGPIMDRIDMWVEVNSLDNKELLHSKNESDKNYTDIIKKSNQKQLERQNTPNAEIEYKDIHTFCKLIEPAQKTLEQASKKLNLSPRAIHKTIKIAQTITDLNEENNITEKEILEALQYRSKL